jgi:hypothetical protein
MSEKKPEPDDGTELDRMLEGLRLLRAYAARTDARLAVSCQDGGTHGGHGRLVVHVGEGRKATAPGPHGLLPVGWKALGPEGPWEFNITGAWERQPRPDGDLPPLVMLDDPGKQP